MKGGLVSFLPWENSCFTPQILTSFFAKILFDVNIVLHRLITFFCISRYMKLPVFLLGVGTTQWPSLMNQVGLFCYSSDLMLYHFFLNSPVRSLVGRAPAGCPPCAP